MWGHTDIGRHLGKRHHESSYYANCSYENNNFLQILLISLRLPGELIVPNVKITVPVFPSNQLRRDKRVKSLPELNDAQLQKQNTT